jgi:uncharacterized protein (TIGR03118 family)
VNDNSKGISVLYDGGGQPFPPGNQLIVTIPTASGTETSAPTGIAFNGSSDFEVNEGNPARFIFVTEDGTISGWNPNVDLTQSVIKVDHSGTAIYKGVTLGQRDGANFLYAANFESGTV